MMVRLMLLLSLAIKWEGGNTGRGCWRQKSCFFSIFRLQHLFKGFLTFLRYTHLAAVFMFFLHTNGQSLPEVCACVCLCVFLRFSTSLFRWVFIIIKGFWTAVLIMRSQAGVNGTVNHHIYYDAADMWFSSSIATCNGSSNLIWQWELLLSMQGQW